MNSTPVPVPCGSESALLGRPEPGTEARMMRVYIQTCFWYTRLGYGLKAA